MLDIRSVRLAREQYISTGVIPERLRSAVRTEIAMSWSRSRTSGARPDVVALPRTADDSAAAASLRQAARPVLDRLADSLDGLTGSVLLADGHGHLIDGRTAGRRTASRRTASRGSSAAEPGVSCSELLIGTNGIGTALADGHPKAIRGPEHWAEIHTGYTCIAVPVIHPVSRRPAGVVALSIPREDVHPALTSIVRWSAQGVRRALLEQSALPEHLLLGRFLSQRKQDRPRLLLSEHLYLADPVAAELLPDIDAKRLWRELAAVQSEQGELREIELAGGAVLSVQVTPLALGETDRGLLLEFQPQRRAPRRRSGAAAQAPSLCFAVAFEAAQATASTARVLLLTGEPGAGKADMAARLFPAAERDGSLVTMDVQAAEDNPDAWLAELREAARSAAVVVLLHLDQVSAPCTRRLLAVADTIVANQRGPRLVATATEVPRADDPAIPAGAFELFALFMGTTVALPPLRDRSADLPQLVREMTTGLGSRTRWSGEALDVLVRRGWPGNLRELQDVVTRTVRQAGGLIRKEDLPLDVRQQIDRTRLTRMERAERDTIMAALEASRGNKVIAADELGISRSSLYRKIERYGLAGARAVAR
jgi:transcriptional regulator of acetoin/glycerol metabolism